MTATSGNFKTAFKRIIEAHFAFAKGALHIILLFNACQIAGNAAFSQIV